MAEIQINNVIGSDCITALKMIPDNTIDMTFADPPFNLNKRYGHYDDSRNFDDYIEWCGHWINEMVRVTKPTGAIFVHNIPRWLTFFAGILNRVAYFRHWIAWDSGGAPLGKTLLPNHYGILYYTKSESYKNIKYYDIRYPHPRCRKCKEMLKDYGGKKEMAHGFGPLVSDVWTDIHRIRHKVRRDEHPCQLPIPLLERLILMTTDESDIVLDPFLGTGTTAVAAKQLGRNFVGIEVDPNYVKIAEKNIRNAQQTKINGCFVSKYLGKLKTIRDIDYEKIILESTNMGKIDYGSIKLEQEELTFISEKKV